MKNARPLERSNGRARKLMAGCERLEHAEHDGADKGKGEIGSDNAQLADESHGEYSLVHVATFDNAQG